VGQCMFVHEATAILNQVPGIELRLRRNTVKFNPQAIPEIDVRYRGSSIGYIEKQLMDEVWHLEDPETGREFPKGTPGMVSSRMHWRAPWPQTFAVIASKISPRDKEVLMHAARKRGFEWWKVGKK
jgi:hypothetical protein